MLKFFFKRGRKSNVKIIKTVSIHDLATFSGDSYDITSATKVQKILDGYNFYWHYVLQKLHPSKIFQIFAVIVMGSSHCFSQRW